MAGVIRLTANFEDGDALERAILVALAEKLNEVFRKAEGGIRGRLAGEVEAAVKNTPEYSSLLTSTLWHELGVRNPANATETIIETIQTSIVVQTITVRRIGSRLEGGMLLKILRADFADILGLSVASFISFPSHAQIDWLRWLLLEGDSILIGEYHFESGYGERSRTGDGIMLEGGTWRVPAEFSGTLSDNWLTRALIGFEVNIKKILIEEIKRQL